MCGPPLIVHLLLDRRRLSLSTNAILQIQPLPSLRNLKILSLSRNAIKRIERLDEVSNSLEELWLSYNGNSPCSLVTGFLYVRAACLLVCVVGLSLVVV